MPRYRHNVTGFLQVMTEAQMEASGGSDVFEDLGPTDAEERDALRLEALANKTEVEGLTVDSFGNPIGPDGQIEMKTEHSDETDGDKELPSTEELAEKQAKKAPAKKSAAKAAEADKGGDK